MAVFCRIYSSDQVLDHEITDRSVFTVGSGKKDLVPLAAEGFGKAYLRLEKDADAWTYRAAKPIAHGKMVSRSGRLSMGELLLLDSERRLALAIFETSPDDAVIADLSAQSSVVIGRGGSCHITVPSKLISGQHLELRRTANGWSAHDLHSSNGTFLNGKRIEEAALHPGDVLDLGFCRLLLNGDALTVSHFGGVRVNIVQPVKIKSAASPEEEYPYAFRRSPRLKEEIPAGEIDFLAAPQIGGKPDVNWAGVLISPLASVAVMLGVCLMLGGAMTMLYFSVPMTLIGLVMSVFNYRRQGKKFRHTEQLRLKKYEAYLAEKENEIKQRQTAQWRIATAIHPVTADCVAIAAEPARRLWERRFADADFMELRVGGGDLPSCVSCRFPPRSLSLQEDALADRPERMAKRYQTVANCPITCHMGSIPACGVIGEREACVTLAKNMLIQAATHHSYEELRIVVVCGKDEWPKWEFTKWLPHSFNDTRSERYLADSPASAKRVFSQLNEVFSARRQEEDSHRSTKGETPYYLFVCADPSLIDRSEIMRHLISGDTALGVGAIFLYDDLNRLPQQCGMILEVKGGRGFIYHKDNAAEKTPFVIDSLRDEQYDIFARALAPVRIEETSGKGALPTSVSFLQGYSVRRPADIDLPPKWPLAQPERSMAVPIGVRDNGESFCFDIHEKRHGPHGIVAGMTGSGKSEMVQSWILSMALCFPPEAVSFVLIDFKGTGLILPFRNLPHLAGTISDLDTNISRNLIALKNELTRRKELFDGHGVSNIAGYWKLYRQGRVETPLSYLFLVIDEFAEFKVQFPDFMEVVNRVFATGRTLGVHIVLLTQKPSGVIDDKMSANTRFRWCLKVASSADSREMLHHPDAAKITNPGRAYVQVGEDEVFEAIQSYWSGAPYNPYHDPAQRRSKKVSVVDRYGLRQSYEPEKTTGFRAEQNESDALVEYLDSYARKNGIPRARNIWTQKLPSVIILDQILQIAFDGERWNENEQALAPAVGMLDDPRSQSQYPLKLNFADDGHVAVYGAPGVGKTTFLQSLVMSLALSYPPDMVTIYLMDFGGGSLNLFSGLPHVGGVARDTEEEKLGRLARLIAKEHNRRKDLFGERGVVGIDSYREASGDKLPYIVLILDNFAPVLQLFPELDQFFQTMAREGANYGMYLVLTANAHSNISYRISQNIKTGVALRMPDRADYAAILGKTDGMEPENLPGRGLCRGTPPLEFQTALPAPGENENQRIASIRQLVQLMGEKWKGKRPLSVPVMPETVCASDYIGDGLLLGLAAESMEPVMLDLAAKQFLLLSAAKDGDKEVFQAILGQLPTALVGAEFVLYDPAGGASDALLKGFQSHISDASQFDSCIAALMPRLQERKDRVQAGGSLEEYPLIVIIVGDLGRCFDGAANDTVKRLASIVNLGRGLRVCLIVRGRGEDITRLYHGGDLFTVSMAEHAEALLIGGSFQSHGIFKSDMGYTELAAELAAPEGYYVNETGTVRLKCVQG